MYKKQLQLFALVLIGVIVISGITYFVGFRRGVASIPDVDRITDLTHKSPDGSALSSGVLPTTLVDFGPFWRTWRILSDTFVPFSTSTTINGDVKIIGAIQGLVNSYDDPYTVFFPPKETGEFKETIRGAFEGIGSVIGLINGVPTAIQPLKDSPAERAGLEANDSILAIDGRSTIGIFVYKNGNTQFF